MSSPDGTHHLPVLDHCGDHEKDESKRQREMLTEKQLSSREKSAVNWQAALSCLKGIPDSEKTPSGILRSRIEEQSRLINSLKLQSDQASTKLQMEEKINNELSSHQEFLDSHMNEQVKKNIALDLKFHQLAKEHEALVQTKNHYKHFIQQLQDENNSYKRDNEQQFSKLLHKKNSDFEELHKNFATLNEQYSDLEVKYRELQKEGELKEIDYNKRESALHELHTKKVTEIQEKISATEETLEGVKYELSQLDGKKEEKDESTRKTFEKLVQEQEHLLELERHHDHLIQMETEEKNQLKEKLEEMKQSLQAAKDRFNNEASAISVNLQVTELTSEITSTQNNHKEICQEFEAFKLHSKNLLEREMHLNQKLKLLTG